MPASSRILGLARGRVMAQAPHFVKPNQVRFKSSMVSTKTSGHQKADWGHQWKKIGNTAAMYGPLVAVLMFWPYTVKPVMDRVPWN